MRDYSTKAELDAAFKKHKDAMAQFQKRSAQPLRADSYRRLARISRWLADAIDRHADAVTADDIVRRSKAVDALLWAVRSVWRREREKDD